MRLVTIGTRPQMEQMWKSAVFVSKLYFDVRSGSLIAILSEPVGQAVQTPPCRMQNEQEQARAGISVGSGDQSSTNEMFLQWQLPTIGIPMTCRLMPAARPGNSATPAIADTRCDDCQKAAA